jgi:nucleotide-binding universal stress UspA family protein
LNGVGRHGPPTRQGPPEPERGGARPAGRAGSVERGVRAHPRLEPCRAHRLPVADRDGAACTPKTRVGRMREGVHLGTAAREGQRDTRGKREEAIPKAAPRGAGGSGYRRILWPTDFSPLAKTALPHALRVAGPGAELIVLHVLSPAAIYAIPGMAAAAWDELERQSRSAAQAELRRLSGQLKRKGAKLSIHTVLAEGVPFEQVVRVAKRHKCDVLVLATHGRTGLRHVLMGSVAENVVRRAPCPVLTVRPPGLMGAKAR